MRSSTVTSLLLLLFLFFACSREVPVIDRLNGRTMGTTYQVSFPSDLVDASTLKNEIDSILVALNLSVSTYIDSSLISILNASTDTSEQHPVDEEFIRIYNAAEAIYESTGGSFNPAVGPLVEAWGFGASAPGELSDDEVDSLRLLVDFEAFEVDAQNKTIKKSIPQARLDFNAIAKGYGVDLIGSHLESKGISDYFVEIGGEVRTRGMHPEGRPWRLGIDRPDENSSPTERTLQAIIPLGNDAIATSGNYRNFYVRDGKKYVHTINPETGYPEISSLLSVSVLAENCTEADGYATAFMVMGLARASAFVEEMEGLEAYFISADSSGEFVETFSEGFPEKLSD